jgi:hypothetical protein
MLYILIVINSPIYDKRFRAIFNNNTHLDFGMRWSECYIDHHCPKRRLGYWKMIYNSNEKELLYWLMPSDTLLTTYLLYGETTDLIKNIEILNNELKKNIIL